MSTDCRATPVPPAGASSLARGELAFAVLLAIGVLLPLLFPGDVPFIKDEPTLIGLAQSANQQGGLAGGGLRGSFGVYYHPVVVWAYQLLLLVTRHLEVIVLLKVILTLAVVLGSLAVLARRTGFARWPVLLVLLSPYLYYFCRTLWDNVFLIPAAALLFAFHAAYAAKPSPGGWPPARPWPSSCSTSIRWRRCRWPPGA